MLQQEQENNYSIVNNTDQQQIVSQNVLKNNQQLYTADKLQILNIKGDQSNKMIKMIKLNPWYYGIVAISLLFILTYNIIKAGIHIQDIIQDGKLIKAAPKIYEIELLKNINDLPICLFILPSQKYSSEELIRYVRWQQYSNVATIRLSDITPFQNQQQINFYDFKRMMEKKCKLNSLIVFVNSPLKIRGLKKLNYLMQKYRAYVAYSNTSSSTEVLAFYPRIYQLLDLNDFDKTKQTYLKDNNIQVQTLGMLQLSSRFAMQIDKAFLFDPEQPTYFSIQKNNTNKIQRTKYKSILRLSQDMPLDIKQFQYRLNCYKKISSTQTIYRLTYKNMYRAVDRQQIWYLPEGHSIQQLQYEQYDKKYNISKYQDISKQNRFCITIMSHNNIQHQRYIKVLKSILQQKYDNYYLVFMDDVSDDNTMNATRSYLRSVGFPQSRVSYVQNLKRNFATYNIFNAAYNYCGADDIQVLLDGDDEIIGRYALQVINSHYHLNPNAWVVYSNYKDNCFTFGRSDQVYQKGLYLTQNGDRRKYGYLGPIRTWKVKVLFNIPAFHQKMKNGEWLDTLYDDALGHPLVQLCTLKRMLYIKQALYEYNRAYGANDDSTQEKAAHRNELYFEHILKLKPLKPLETLEGTVKDQQIQKQLSADRGVRYI